MGDEIVGTSRGMERVRRLIREASADDRPFLLIGEPGTGRELAARAIHARSARVKGPFVVAHLRSLPEAALEGDLFGRSLKGLAGAGSRGLLEEAREGSIFLDGISRLPADLQSKLLRVLGPAGPRIIATDEADLEPVVRKGHFSRELFSALGSLSIYLPPLRERNADLMLLAEHFLRTWSVRYQKTVLRLSTPALELLTSWRWPGNVRELEDVIGQAVLRSREGVIRSQDLPAALQTGASSRTTLKGRLSELMMAYEREILLEAIQNAAGNKSRAARALGTTPRILAYRLRKHGL